jgi:enamine deaminase RidA (YjgF/YER057c/UK114 family)
VLGKIEVLLKEAGTDKSKLVAVNVFLPQIGDFDAMNAVYDRWIDPANPPARACVEARLADPDLRVEMTAVALL